MPDVAALPWEFMRVPMPIFGTLWVVCARFDFFSAAVAVACANPIQLARNEKLRIAVAVVCCPLNFWEVVYDKVDAFGKAGGKSMPDQIELLPV